MESGHFSSYFCLFIQVGHHNPSNFIMPTFGTLAHRGNSNGELSEKWAAVAATATVIPFVTAARQILPAENAVCGQEFKKDKWNWLNGAGEHQKVRQACLFYMRLWLFIQFVCRERAVLQFRCNGKTAFSRHTLFVKLWRPGVCLFS